ncbi:fibronectin type III domain-containing protein [Candidatus Nitrosotenuis aquarius]|uniref:fibronectin type III domain-containing protein n=1 Tax=Candidatus Nitrosotenuis aquarius TaxID=1846278 RepID=UPI000C1DDE3B|nr:fibronectin type III domain-containing protein [Candidatus Nitrosotenuis aquarius]
MKTTGIVLILLVATLALPLGNSFAEPANPPTNLVAQSISSTQINLSWNAPVNSTQSLVNGYKIERDAGCLGTFSVLVSNHTSTKYNNTGLMPAKCYAYKVFALNPSGVSASSNTAQAATPPAPSTNQTKPTDNLGQKVSDFVHKRNELLKKQREETLKLIRECQDKANNATSTTRKQIMEDCRESMKALKDKYKDVREQFKEEFKTFKKDAKSLLKEAKKTGLITKKDIREAKHEIRDFENDTKREYKELKHDIKDVRKDLKKELKELKKEQKKNKHHDDDKDDDD